MRGDISSRLLLNASQFYKAADDALKKAQQTATGLTNAFKNPIVAPRVRPAPSPDANGQKAAIESARQASVALKQLELQYRKNRLSASDYLQTVRAIEAVLEAEQRQVLENTKAYAAYTVVLRQAENQLTRGTNTRPVVGGIDAVSDALDRLQAAAALLLSGNGVIAFFRRLDAAAGVSFQASTGLNLFNRELAKANETAAAGRAVLAGLSEQFGINQAAIAGDAANILRYGANLEATEEILLRTGASAVVRGRKFSEGSRAAAEALNGEFSAALNLIGVAGNLSTYFQRYAREVGVATEALTRQQKVEAFLNLLRAETGTEVEALVDIYTGYGKAVQTLATAQQTFAQSVGGKVAPALALLKNVAAATLNAFSALPGPLQAVIIAATTLTVVLGGLGVAYVTLNRLLFNQQVLGASIVAALANETVARSRLGAVLLGLGTRYKLLTADQIAQAATTRAGAASMTLMQLASASLSRTLTVLNGVFKALLFTPQGRALLAVAVAAGALATNLNVLKPALEGLKASFAPLTGFLQGAVTALGKFFKEGTILNTFLQRGLTETAKFLSLGLASLGFAFESVVNAGRYFVDFFKGSKTALSDFDRRQQESVNRYLDTGEAILGAASAARAAATANETLASSTDKATTAAKKLTAEQKKQRSDFQDRAAQFAVEFDQTGLEADIASAQSSIQSFIDEVGAAADALPLGSKLREQYRTIELDLLGLRERVGGKVIADALTAAQDETAAAVVGSMREGAAKISAQRTLDLETERRGFAERTNALVEGSETYNEFLALYNARAAAINTTANRALEEDAARKLQVSTELRKRIEGVATDLRNAVATAGENPVKRITGEFQAAARAIKTETDGLLRDVETALAEGAISQTEADKLIADVQRTSRARLVQAEREKTVEIRKVLEERKEEQLRIAEEAEQALQAQATALRSARIAGLDGDLPQQQAQFRAEQETRLDGYARALGDFKGNAADRARLVSDQNATEVLLARQHQQTVNRAEQSGLDAYLNALKQHQTEVATARREARDQELQNQQALLSARRASAEGQITSGDTAGYAALVNVQRDAVTVARELTQATRERGASAAEVVGTLQAEAEAQRGVVDALTSQRDALIAVRQEQLGVINSGSEVLEYARAAAELSGRDLNERDAGAALRAQAQAQLELYRAQIAGNATLGERLETLKQIQESEQALAELGQRSALTGGDRQLISQDAADSLDAYPEQAATALEQIRSLDQQIAQLGVTLQAATGELGTLLEAAGSGEGLQLKVAVKIDETGLEAARKALRETFGEAAANRIVSQTEGAGARAGRGLAGAFAKGLTDNKQTIMRAVESVLRDVRAYLPSSDAKRGPLSTLTYSGGALVRTFAGGMERRFGDLRGVSQRMAAIAKPALTVPAVQTVRSLAAPAGAPGPGGAPTIGAVYLDGSRRPATGILSLEAKNFAKSLVRELDLGGV